MKSTLQFSSICGCCFGIEFFTTEKELLPIHKFVTVFDIFILRIIFIIFK